MRYFKIVLILFLCTSLAYCVKSRISTYPGFNYDSKDPVAVQVFNIPPTVEFEIIGEVEGRGAPASSWGSVEGSMKKKAASIGGDAIILVSKREPYVGTLKTADRAHAFVYGNYIYYTYQPGSAFSLKQKHIIGLVIKWKIKSSISTKHTVKQNKDVELPIKKSTEKASPKYEKKKKNIQEGDIVSLGLVDVAPVCVKSVTPKYDWRRFYSQSARFVIKVLISESGDVLHAKIISDNVYKDVRNALLDAVKQWKYKPALKDGVKVRVWKQITIRINID